MHDTNKVIYEFFTDDDFVRISNEIKKAEKTTSGEIKLSLKEKRKFTEKKKSLFELAAEDFARYKMSSTRDKTGVLIFLLLSEKQFFIYADKGINEKVEQSVWQSVSKLMENEFSRGRFTEGIILGIREISSILSKYFPIKEDDTNELSDAVEID